LYERQAHHINKIGSLFQTLTQLDFQDPEEVSSSSSSSNGDANKLAFSMIRTRPTTDNGKEIRALMTSLA